MLQNFIGKGFGIVLKRLVPEINGNDLFRIKTLACIFNKIELVINY